FMLGIYHTDCVAPRRKPPADRARTAPRTARDATSARRSRFRAGRPAAATAPRPARRDRRPNTLPHLRADRAGVLPADRRAPSMAKGPRSPGAAHQRQPIVLVAARPILLVQRKDRAGRACPR